jgi:hypothetical protein
VLHEFGRVWALWALGGSNDDGYEDDDDANSSLTTMSAMTPSIESANKDEEGIMSDAGYRMIIAPTLGNAAKKRERSRDETQEEGEEWNENGHDCGAGLAAAYKGPASPKHAAT